MNVLIIGATQGLGQALAEIYLAQNHRVCICGRDLNKLRHWPFREHPKLSQFALDINSDQQLQAMFDLYRHKDLDLMINCVGIYVNNRQQALNKEQSLMLVETNVLALNKILNHSSRKMLQQGSGQIVALSSAAALINYTGASLYSASKRSVLSLCDTYRCALRPFKIRVTAVVPGYINTSQLRALNGGDASDKLFIMQLDKAANLIVEGIAKGREQLVFPRRMYWLMRVLALIPQPLLSYFLTSRDARNQAKAPRQ
ncbi:MAG: hypothetical protein OFPII_41980 [Osedax symbiont Rs1]|nr:MAG: hypothetical protein OFPII_41980 [Osedax symbiont Rs1]